MDHRIIVLAIINIVFILVSAEKEKPIFCFYELTHKKIDEILKIKLNHCTHLLIRPGTIGENKGTALRGSVTSEQNKVVYPEDNGLIRDLKKLYPRLLILLTVGGEHDPVPDDKNNKYMKLLTSESKIQHDFIKSTGNLSKHYYDGINLAWNFPTCFSKPTYLGSFYNNVKYLFTQPTDYKTKFTEFLSNLRKYSETNDDFMITVTVNPNVNMPDYSLPKETTVTETNTDGTRTTMTLTNDRSTPEYFQPKAISLLVDYVILQAFDFYSPRTFPNEAYFPSALYSFADENEYANADFVVQYWLKKEVQPGKLILGIPTFGRAWKMNDKYTDVGISPFEVTGQYTSMPDKVPYRNAFVSLRIIRDPVHDLGSYGLRLPTDDQPEGVWVGFEEPITAVKKAKYVLANSLGGVAIDDINIDENIILQDTILQSVYKTLRNNT